MAVMHRLHLSKLRSLGRRNFTQSPELPRRSNTVVHPPKPSHPPRDADFSPALRPPILAPSMSRFRCKLSSGRSIMEKDCRRRFSTFNPRDDMGIEEDVERKAGWVLKLMFLASGSFVIYNFYPYMGDSLLQQSISLLNVKDPLFKRIGASRLTRFATDDGRRMRVVEMGGAHKLLKVLEDAKDDKTRKEALKALSALSHAVEAAVVLHEAGAIAIINATPNSVEVESYKSTLLDRFQQVKNDHLSAGEGKAS